MSLLGKEVRILLVMVILGAGSFVALVQYTDICRLQAVTLNGRPVTNPAELGLRPGYPIVRQPLDSLADALLMQRGIVHVDIDYKLPNALRITTNSLEPQCYLLDAATGGIYGLEETGRVVPVAYEKINWDAPLFTGVRVRRLHEHPADGRVLVMLSHLQRLRHSDESLYRQVEEIDLSRVDFAMVTVANKSYRLKVRPEEFADRYGEFTQFMTRYSPGTDSTTSFDLTYANVIIRQGYVEPKEKPVIDTAEMNDKAAIFDESETAAETSDAQILARAMAAEKPAASLGKGSVGKSTARKSDGAKQGTLKAKTGAKPGKLNTSKNQKKSNSKAGATSKNSKTSVNKKTTSKPSQKTTPKKKTGSTPSKKTNRNG